MTGIALQFTRLSKHVRLSAIFATVDPAASDPTYSVCRLDLATTDELRLACRTVHFSEQFHHVNGQRHMTFDYRIMPGIAETTNALKLLEMVGLGED